MMLSASLVRIDNSRLIPVMDGINSNHWLGIMVDYTYRFLNPKPSDYMCMRYYDACNNHTVDTQPHI
jgi:hypothetical protein